MPTDTQTATPGLQSVVMCSKCHQNPRADADGTNPWCKDCNADYQRTYEAGKAAKIKDLGFGKGAEAMRAALVGKLRAMHPTAMLSAGEVAKWISTHPMPRPDQT